jgi:ferredoxin
VACATRVFAETFGPSALARQPDAGAPVAVPAEAVVDFTASGIEAPWSAGGPSPLDLAERHGLAPAFGCRHGACGACAASLTSGVVAYRTQPTADIPGGATLICCAVPAAGVGCVEIGL